jgi:tetratricopeptide (TPR) repeat protein
VPGCESCEPRRFPAATAAAEEAVELAATADHPYSEALALSAAGRWRALQGNFNEALPWFERSLEACRREGFYSFSIVAACTGTAYVRTRRVADGIALLEEAAERGAALGFILYRPGNLSALAEGHLLSGRLEDAFRTVRQALDLSRASKQRGYEADTLHIFGEVQAREDAPDWAGAEESYPQALALAADLSMRPLAACCHLGLGRLYRQAGKRSAVEAHLTVARTMLPRWRCASGLSTRRGS